MMARMKRLFLAPALVLFALMLVLCPPPARAARADAPRYAVAADTNVWFYSAEGEEYKLFLLPETYYVRVLYKDDLYTAVEYLVNDAPYRKIMGYCRTEALTFVEFIPERPYLKRQITVSYTLPGAGGGFGEFDSIERTFVYYGKRYENGQLYFYVLEGETFGFIPAEEELSFERNDDFLNVPAGPAETDPSEAPPSDASSVLQIVLILAVCGAAVVVAVLALRGKKPANHEEHDF